MISKLSNNIIVSLCRVYAMRLPDHAKKSLTLIDFWRFSKIRIP